MARDALNYEIAVAGGYQDLKGYERFDGRPKPSDASFTIVDVVITGAIAVGNTVTGAVTGATGKVIAIAAYPDVPAQTYLVLTKVTGLWNNAAENVQVAAVNQGHVSAVGYADSAPTSKLKAQYKNLAADVYRADITAVPGEGSTWGGFTLGADKYAIRNAIGGATAALFKATVAGWSAVAMGREVAYTSGGVYVVAIGDVITGATSGATATVRRIQLSSGTFGAGTAAGYLTLSGQVGNFVAENLNVGANLNVATIAGNSTAQTLAPNGHLDYHVSNFANPRGAARVYCADSVNTGWEFDGTYLVFIHTGMVNDKPSHVHVHKKQLFLSFDGSSQESGLGDPLAWAPVLGASEIATGSKITGYHTEPGSAGDATLLIATAERFHMLYGNDSADWNLVPYRDEVGAYEWTTQALAQTYFLGGQGIANLQAVQQFGNFQHSTMSQLINALIIAKRPLAVGSTIVRNKNQYRLFFSDKSAIFMTMNGRKLMGMMPVVLDHQMVVAWSELDPNKNEETFFGATDGFVYQMEKGTSFDGNNIYAFLETHFDHADAIEWEKTFFSPVTVEGKGGGYAEFDLTYKLDYGRSEVFQPDSQTAVMPATQGAAWDTGGLSWDTFIAWDSTSLVPTVGLDLRGDGRNISWLIVKNSDYFEPLLLSGVHYLYVLRKQIGG